MPGTSANALWLILLVSVFVILAKLAKSITFLKAPAVVHLYYLSFESQLKTLCIVVFEGIDVCVGVGDGECFGVCFLPSLIYVYLKIHLLCKFWHGNANWTRLP